MVSATPKTPPLASPFQRISITKKHRLNTFKSQPRNHTSYPAPDLITLKPHRYCLNVAQQFSKYIYTNIEEERAFPEQQEGSCAPCVWWMHSSKPRRNVR